MKAHRRTTLPNLPESMELVWAIKYALLWGHLPAELLAELGPIDSPRKFELVSLGAIHYRGSGQCYTNYRVAKVRVLPKTEEWFTVALILRQDVYVDDASYQSSWELTTAIKRIDGVRRRIAIRECMTTPFGLVVSDGWIPQSNSGNSMQWCSKPHNRVGISTSMLRFWNRCVRWLDITIHQRSLLRNWDRTHAEEKTRRDEVRRMRRQASV